MKPSRIKKHRISLVLIMLLLFPVFILAQEKMSVNVKNVARAETDLAIKKLYETSGGFGRLFHYRTPTPIKDQPVIRMNRDVLYSGMVLDLSQPVTITLPESNGRYQSLQIINQDHYTYAETKPGTYTLTQEKVGSRFAYVSIRTFIDANNPDDIKEANALQDAIKVEGGGDGPLDLPEWDAETLEKARKALNSLAELGVSNKGAFGLPDEVDPVNFLVFSVAGWGGLPNTNTIAYLGTVDQNDGTPYAVTVKDVPVNAFWSVIVYDENGFIPENDMNVYSFNNVTAQPNQDGSITINFGGCQDGRINCIPVSKGWNYAIRLYEPQKEVIDGNWTFPEIRLAN